MARKRTNIRTDLISFALILIMLAELVAIAVFAFVLLRATSRKQEREAQAIPALEEPAAPPEGTPPITAAPAAEPTGLIVYTCFDGSYDDLCIMRADGSEQRQLTDTAATDWYPSLGPDGDTVVFSSRRTGVFEIYRLSLSTGEVVQLTDGMGGSYAPELSPDGSRIVFASSLNGKLDVYVMDADGGNITRLTDHPADDLDPTWSPDGTRVAFASNRTGTNELYIMDVPAAPGELGQNVRQVTNGSNMQEGGRSDWSPDGSTLAFYAGDPGDKDIFLVPVECAEQVEGCGPDALTRLTEGGNNKAPSFSPDGQWIAFASNLRGDNNVFIMRVDGSDWRQLTTQPSADWQPRWGP
ncbi:MAG TPA: DPP IV N-terminal domain-containing protein [Aggregatilineales bacterium]|nr:DPP IV N-terminal domain-containing protein [Aggregatilineales bacterium]HPV08312.1 DPP IV N-terminal domain-containing protein [Aggregatilineales bacterium]HQA67615.1 DPP IV N-terminal domain-containing protein [Aggregatilineales bacterium]HQE16909.1 DPP IV N-terminal domain-containing protein [Aggregatilineales bacterium]